MVIIILINAPASVKGVITRYLHELSTGIYLGTMNRKVREEIWGFIRGNIGRGSAIIASSNNSVQGYDVETINLNRKQIAKHDGIKVLHESKDQNPSDKIHSNWSKQGKWAKWKK